MDESSFMGVYDHLRYRCSRSISSARRTRRLMMFQTLTLPGDSVYKPNPDCTIEDPPLLGFCANSRRSR